ncbi:MAG: hypothetical protein JO040_11040 [Gemmatimonadetes bacterium]|nr:hypothetical protein [Gemmatimonadota bacterium]
MVLLLGLAACSDRDAEMAFAVRPLKPGTLPTFPTVRAEGGPGTIVVRGRLEAPSPCQAVSGKVTADGAGVTVRVEAEPRGVACPDVISPFGYDATVSGLGRGRYRLRVVHAYPGTGWGERTVLDQEVPVH